MAITMGSDPELFVMGHRGWIVPAFDVVGNRQINLPAGKLKPDGAALEFTLNPATTVLEFVQNMRANIRALTRMPAIRRAGALDVSPAVEVNPDDHARLDTSYPAHTSLQVFGCSPDITMWSVDEAVRPDPTIYRVRATGGHIHLGGLDLQPARLRLLVAALDLLVAVPLSVQFSRVQGYQQRKESYGRLGVIRLPGASMVAVPDRIEWRPLAAKELVDSPAQCAAVMNAVLGITNRVAAMSINGCGTLFEQIADALPIAAALYDSGGTAYDDCVRTAGAILDAALGCDHTRALGASTPRKLHTMEDWLQ